MNGVESRELVVCFRENKISYVNIRSHFAKILKRDGVHKYFYEGDGHPTEYLTKLIAELVASEAE